MLDQLNEGKRLISLEQSVVRVLVLLYYAGTPTDEDGFARCIESNVKLQKMDFLLRNPDYLREMLKADANEANHRGESERAEALRSMADTVDATGEPEILAERMGKHLYGPFEHDYESIYGYAVSRQLMKVRRVQRGAPNQREVLLTLSGWSKVEEMLPSLEELAWYASHASLIARCYGTNDGSELEALLCKRFSWIRNVPNLGLIGPFEEYHARRTH